MYRFEAVITDGPSAGHELTAIQGSDVPLLGPDRPLIGDTQYVGEACTPASIAPPGNSPIAVIARGTCDFQVKYDNVVAAGYEAGIVFNSNSTNAGCEGLISMLVSGDSIPFLFVPRADGIHLLGLHDEARTRARRAARRSRPTRLRRWTRRVCRSRPLFDGWGYTHLYRQHAVPTSRRSITTRSRKPSTSGTRPGSATSRVHEFATDPNANVAYSSYYAGGMRVFTFGDGRSQADRQVHRRGRQQLLGRRGRDDRLGRSAVRRLGSRLRPVPVAVHRAERRPAAVGPAGLAARVARIADPAISNKTVRVSKKRYVSLPVSCPATVGTQCRGKLEITRRAGWHTLATKWFAKKADTMSGVRLRLSRPEFRRLKERRRQSVTVELLTRGVDGQLRHAATKVTLLAPRR